MESMAIQSRTRHQLEATKFSTDDHGRRWTILNRSLRGLCHKALHQINTKFKPQTYRAGVLPQNTPVKIQKSIHNASPRADGTNTQESFEPLWLPPFADFVGPDEIGRVSEPSTDTSNDNETKSKHEKSISPPSPGSTSEIDSIQATRRVFALTEDIQKPLEPEANTEKVSDKSSSDQTADYTVDQTWRPAVTHETIVSQVHEIREEHIIREVHHHEVLHQILPVIDVEVLPARHFVRGEQGDVEISRDEVPSCVREVVDRVTEKLTTSVFS